jgi:hypothetical protein
MNKYLVSAFLVGLLSSSLAQADFLGFGCKDEKGTEVPVAAPLADKLTATIKKLPKEGAAIEKIELFNGIRAMDGEIATPGEVKILVNLNWVELSKNSTQRQALDNTAARIIAAVFSEHGDVTKLRVIVRTQNAKGKYQAAAKVFSFTRATWELVKNNPRYDVSTLEGVVNLLALGDYVILTDKGWMRGY